MAQSTVTLKLLIDTQGQRVLFAEAGKDCVDFLFHILSLPMATVIRLLRTQGMVGSLANLYESIENLNETYIQSDRTKDTLLKPLPPLSGSSVPLLISDAATDRKFYRCAQCMLHVSDDPRAVCPNCRRKMNQATPYVAPPAVQQASEEGGFVKGVVTYMVMDDLVVKPMSTISSITLLNKFNIKDVGGLEEKVVSMGMDEAVKLLKASLERTRVLTHVFMKLKVSK